MKQKFIIINLERTEIINVDGTKFITLAFWKEYGIGYTSNLWEAGLYTKEELDRESLSSDDLVFNAHWFGENYHLIVGDPDARLYLRHAENGLPGGIHYRTK